jgi:transposase
MSKSITGTLKDIEKYKPLTELLGLVDLNVVKQERNEEEQLILLYCLPKWDVDVCPKCGHLTPKVHDYPEQRRIHDAPLRGTKTMLVFDARRFRCRTCQHVFTQTIRDVVPDCTYTYRLAAEIGDPKRKQDVQTLATVYQIGYKTVESILFKAADDKLAQRRDQVIEVTHLGIDEQSNRKGRGSYILVLTDLERRIVLDILPDREKSTLIHWLKHPPAGIDLSQLASVATDLWRHYRDAVYEVFDKQVPLVADRFHVMQNLHEAIHKARKAAQAEAATAEERKTLKGLRYLLLKKDQRLTDSEKERLDALAITHPRLYQLTRLRQSLYEWYEQDLTVADASAQLTQWIKDAQALQFESLDTFCQTLTNWSDEMVNFFRIASPAALLRE